MSLLRVRIIPDPVLRVPASAVTNFDQELKELVDNMWETMYVSKGIGLAAPQVGVSKRVVVIDLAEEGNGKITLINPQITERIGKVKSEEGCLSIPDYRESIQRIKQIKITAQDISGNNFELSADGLLSRCIQHEIDHLDGILFVDHLSRLKRDMFKRWLANNLELDESTEA